MCTQNSEFSHNFIILGKMTHQKTVSYFMIIKNPYIAFNLALNKLHNWYTETEIETILEHFLANTNLYALLYCSLTWIQQQNKPIHWPQYTLNDSSDPCLPVKHSCFNDQCLKSRQAGMRVDTKHIPHLQLADWIKQSLDSILSVFLGWKWWSMRDREGGSFYIVCVCSLR